MVCLFIHASTTSPLAFPQAFASPAAPDMAAVFHASDARLGNLQSSLLTVCRVHLSHLRPMMEILLGGGSNITADTSKRPLTLDMSNLLRSGSNGGDSSAASTDGSAAAGNTEQNQPSDQLQQRVKAFQVRMALWKARATWLHAAKGKVHLRLERPDMV